VQVSSADEREFATAVARKLIRPEVSAAGVIENYMRMAMRAQNQCRMTLETLATIKNPPVVFAKQANINNGGQKQVNKPDRTAAE
jgi:hypothetical protein